MHCMGDETHPCAKAVKPFHIMPGQITIYPDPGSLGASSLRAVLTKVSRWRCCWHKDDAQRGMHK